MTGGRGIARRQLDSLVGTLTLIVDGGQLRAIRFGAEAGATDGMDPVLDEAARQLREYFDGKRRRFELPLAPEGTAFQQDTWHAVAEIDFGRTRSYGEVAEAIGRPKAVRAIGQAVGRNPIPIVIPCHRVLAAGGRIGGYAGGLDRKRTLLALEGLA